MCEPAHSVVQYSSHFDDSDLPFGDYMDKESRLQAALGKAYKWAKKVKGYFHLSRFGAGHSKATMEHSGNTFYLPKATLYEGFWWDREFKLDGWWNETPPIEATEAATEYHESSVMKNMSLFRRFLEESMRRTKHGGGAWVYVDRLLNSVLTSTGANKVLEKFRRVFGRNVIPSRVMGLRESKQNVEKGIKIVMGFTRKRELFLPHFADDDSLWVPGGRVEG